MSDLTAPTAPTAPGAPAAPGKRRAAAVVLAVALLTVAARPALAHVTPNVQLVKRGDFVQQSLPAAVQLVELQLSLAAADLAAIRAATHWTPSQEDTKAYLGRDAQGHLAGIVVFVWVPSEHGPVGIAAAFDAAGKAVQAAVTDVGSEPLAWIKPLLQANAMAAFAGLSPGAALPNAAKLAPAVTGSMSRYYAEVLVQGFGRAQAIARVAHTAAATGVADAPAH